MQQTAIIPDDEDEPDSAYVEHGTTSSHISNDDTTIPPQANFGSCLTEVKAALKYKRAAHRLDLPTSRFNAVSDDGDVDARANTSAGAAASPQQQQEEEEERNDVAVSVAGSHGKKQFCGGSAPQTERKNILLQKLLRVPWGTSKFRGVSKNRHGKWHANIRHNGKRSGLGSFRIEKEAALAYNQAIRRLGRPASWLNDISDDDDTDVPTKSTTACAAVEYGAVTRVETLDRSNCGSTSRPITGPTAQQHTHRSYPGQDEKDEVAAKAGLTAEQVDHFFAVVFGDEPMTTGVGETGSGGTRASSHHKSTEPYLAVRARVGSQGYDGTGVDCNQDGGVGVKVKRSGGKELQLSPPPPPSRHRSDLYTRPG